ncbi:MAG: hypothetical protein AAF655_08615 [Bacteroidota bacterium]
MKEPVNPPLINVHTHIFTRKHVPNHLGKRLIPWPFYLISTAFIIKTFRFFSRNEQWLKMVNLWKRVNYNISYLRYYYLFFRVMFSLMGLAGFLLAMVALGHLIMKTGMVQALEPMQRELDRVLTLPLLRNTWFQIGFVFMAFLFFKWFRKFVLLLLRRVITINEHTKSYLNRLLHMGSFASMDKQQDLFVQLIKLYPKNTQFVVLSMDMEYMDAGKVPSSYKQQLAELLAVSKNAKGQLLPFICVDPRRIMEEENFLQEVKDHLQDGFYGIKLYPALGFYPFDIRLLPLYAYAQTYQIPIMTHCVRGTIHYRGKKEKHWNEHPVFSCQHQEEVRIPLPDFSSFDFTANFTHPLNYECLLDPQLFHRLFQYFNSPFYPYKERDDIRIREVNSLFGYDPETDKPPLKNLQKLKICLAHFGGETEWQRYFDKDRGSLDNKYLNNPLCQISVNTSTEEVLWSKSSWYTIIRNLLVKYEHVYADISYTLTDNRTFPLLEDMLKTDYLKEKVLFGTDYYVVRQEESEKQLLTELMAYLEEGEFRQLSLTNNQAYLERSWDKKKEPIS